MQLTFYSNILNIHQVNVSDELYRLLGENFKFVVTQSQKTSNLKGGENFSSRSYCLNACESKNFQEEAFRLARESDVCVFGACSQQYAVERAKQKNTKLSFEMSERWLKKGLINILSPNCLKWMWNYWRYYRKKPFYKLCMSAFATCDDMILGIYKGKHYKWGYFTKINNAEISQISPKQGVMHILWCARFIDWKHPELAVQLAKKLKDKKYKFRLDFIGSGKQLEPTKKLVENLELVDRVSFLGNIPNDEVIQQMHQHNIFLLTSDRNEGWGVVANEAMSNGCCLVGSDASGSVPYLVIDGATGMIFKSCDLDSLYEKVKYLLDNPDQRQQIQQNAIKQIQTLWSPQNAAKSLLQLITDLQSGKDTSILEGPCSKA